MTVRPPSCSDLIGEVMFGETHPRTRTRMGHNILSYIQAILRMKTGYKSHIFDMGKGGCYSINES